MLCFNRVVKGKSAKLNKNMTTVNSQINSTLCEGCLSSDRQITLLENDDCKSWFYEVINDFDSIKKSSYLCWECQAILKKIILFRKQVKTAHKQLTKCLLEPTCLASLTHLSRNKTTILDIEPTTNTNNDPMIFNIKNEQDITGDDDNSDSSPTILVTTHKNKPINTDNIHIKSEKTQKVTFVKVEESLYLEDDYLDDIDRDSFCADKEFTVVDAKPHSQKRTRKTRKKTEEEFCESDDEALHTKKNAVTTKQGKQSGVVVNASIKKKLQQLNVTIDQVEMVVLSWEEVEAERQQALASIRYTRHDHRCPDCIVGFNHRVKLELHMAKHSPASGDQECNICKVRCKDKKGLYAHQRRHRVRWRCVSCGSLWSRASVAADHVAKAHSTAAPTHNCSVCGHCAPTLSKLRVHMKNHRERQQCPLCQKTFIDKTALKVHLFIHRGEKEYACTHCNKRFLFKKALETHMVTHDAPAHLYCHTCDASFKNKLSYNQHMKYTLKHMDPTQLKYVCTLCDKRFWRATRLEEHKTAVHLKATPVQCPETGCDFACSTRPVLRAHLRMVHRNGRNLRNYVCDVCGKAYMTKRVLACHLRSHTGERPFQCRLCPSAFGYEAALYNHNRLVHLKNKTSRTRLPENSTRK